MNDIILPARSGGVVPQYPTAVSETVVSASSSEPVSSNPPAGGGANQQSRSPLSVNGAPDPDHGSISLWVVGLLVVALLIGGLVWWSRRDSTDPSTSQATNSETTQRLSDLEDKLEQLESQLAAAPKPSSQYDDLVKQISEVNAELAVVEQQAASGAPGARGATGASGAKGDSGATGPAGANGLDGADGAQGQTGPSGTATCDYGLCLSLQASSPGTQETGSINISDDAIIGGVVTAASFSGNGSALSSLNASQLASGTVNNARLSAGVTLQGNSFNGASQLVQLNGSGALPALSGANVTNVDALSLQGNGASYYTNATNVGSGTLADARLSANVALLNASQTFSGVITLSNAGTALIVTNTAQIGTLSVTGNASVTGSLTFGTTLSSSCAGLSGYVWVPGNTKFGTMPGFCVMQYEAKNDGSNNAVSTAAGTPWVSISQRTAQDRSQAACSGCHLITEAEWMTIATNAMWVNANWSGGTVGSGCVFRGNVGNADACGYNGADPEFGTGRDAKASLTLSNGSVIWDISGNVWEWTDAWVQGKEQPNDAVDGFAWHEYTALTDFKGLQYLNPTNRGWNATQGLGRIYSDGTSTNNTQYGFLRGGYWGPASNGGVFSLYLVYDPTITDTNIGFRVAR